MSLWRCSNEPSLDLPVFAKIPEDGKKFPYTGCPAGCANCGEKNFFHHCKQCGGYISGRPLETKIDAVSDNGARQKGTLYFCRRCGREISFIGSIFNPQPT